MKTPRFDPNLQELLRALDNWYGWGHSNFVGTDDFEPPMADEGEYWL